MMDKSYIKLAAILVDEGIITQDELNGILLRQEKTDQFIVEIVAKDSGKSEEEITRLLSTRLGVAYVDMKDITIDPKVMETIPEDECVKLNVLPLYVVSDVLTVVMANPLDTKAIDEIQSISGLKVRPAISSINDLREAVRKHYKIDADGREPLFGEDGYGKKEKTRNENIEVTTDQIAFLKQAASLAPVVEVVNDIITKAVDMGASDIHLEPQKLYMTCRYRIDGVLHLISRVPFKYQPAVISRIKIMSNMDIAEKRLPQDGRVRMFAGQKEVDLRVSTFPTIYGENLVIRILDHSSGVVELSQLGFSTKVFGQFSDLIRRPYGIILVTGPTGSGKTTTLYAALNDINKIDKNIITLEDPVEYEIESIRQSQVNVKAGLTFASGLRSIVRQDPDIIMIGEIRDKETAEISIHAALTGHLVFSTLHTNDAPSAANRLIDMGVEPFLVASSAIGILAQRLVRTLCPHCKEGYTPTKELLTRVGIASFDGKKLFYREAGCKKCNKRGYSGRTAILELILPSDRIKELIAKKSSASVLKEAAVADGMKTLRNAGLEKVIEGITSVAEMIRVTEE
ncbi:MAG: ATPase, T2SS/T4P/T4SS family [Candidatus Omnitrophota bacterium]